MFIILRNAVFAEEKSPCGMQVARQGLLNSKIDEIIGSSTTSIIFETKSTKTYVNMMIWGIWGVRGVKNIDQTHYTCDYTCLEFSGMLFFAGGKAPAGCRLLAMGF